MFSLVIPIHNQESIIERVLNSVVTMTLGYYELILILDGCTDSTPTIVRNWASRQSIELHILENPVGFFETACDNQGFRMAKGKYIIEIQADMEILTFGYNILLASPLEQYPDMIGVSGRCCHGLNTSSTPFAAGKLGEAAKQPHVILQDFRAYNKVFLSHTVNRGPLALRKSMLQELEYLDEEHYTLGNDEHDLFARAWAHKQWRCGFVPVEVYSPLEWGSTRKPRNKSVQAFLEERLKREEYGFLNQHVKTIQFPPSEMREFQIQRTLLDKIECP
jgi:glycosyltransferase involved in cell wall biosynthesis